jgi:hypothetical protein
MPATSQPARVNGSTTAPDTFIHAMASAARVDVLPAEGKSARLTTGMDLPAEVRVSPSTVPQGPLSLDDIYRSLNEAGSIELRAAVTLLRDALKWTDSAISFLESAEPIHADDAMQHVRAIVPELFCCRKLGDGFGSIVNAVQSSLENQHGNPLTENQTRSIRAALHRVLNEPLISFEAAVDQIDRLEAAGLSVDPSFMEAVAELLDDEGLC